VKIAMNIHQRRKQTDWLDDCIKGETGKPLPVLANAITALEKEFAHSFAYDEIARIVMLTKSLHGANDFTARPITDVDVAIVQQHLQHLGLKRVARDTVFQAIDVQANKHRFHPVRHYLDNLQWDGTERVSKLFTDYFGTKSDPIYAAAVGRMFLISLVARIYDPGCKADYVPVIEGLQGTFKSTALRALGGEWFSDSLPHVSTGKEVSQYLRGKWLIEVAEMHAMTRAEVSQLKAFITRQEERYRPSFGRKEVIEPRQCVFVGTTNRDTYLQDETGGRRFWPITSGLIDVERLAKDRDQLFAEAVVLYRKGVPWWPDRDFEMKYMVAEQQARFDADIWEEPIARYLTPSQHSQNQRPTRVTIGEVAAKALKLDANAMGTGVVRRITRCMISLGWQKETKPYSGKYYWSKR
jgi:predicted P-loop ATPase